MREQPKDRSTGGEYLVWVLSLAALVVAALYNMITAWTWVEFLVALGCAIGASIGIVRLLSRRAAQRVENQA